MLSDWLEVMITLQSLWEVVDNVSLSVRPSIFPNIDAQPQWLMRQEYSITPYINDLRKVFGRLDTIIEAFRSAL